MAWARSLQKAGKTKGRLTEKKAYHWSRRAWRWSTATVLALIAVIVLVAVLLLIPSVQNALAHRLSTWATERLGAEVRIGSVSLQPFGPLVFEEVYIGDLRGDTLVAVGRLKVNGLRIDSDARTVDLSSLDLENTRFALATTEGDAHSNLTNLLDKLASGDTTSSGDDWAVRCARFRIAGLHFSFHNGNVPQAPYGVDFEHVDVQDATIAGRRLSIVGDSIGAQFDEFHLRERSGLQLEELSGGTTVSRRGITIEDMVLRTPGTQLLGKLRFTTESWRDYNDFSQRVMMRVELDSSRLEFADVALFAPDLEGVHLPITLQGKVRGTLAELKGRGMTIRFGERSYFKGSAELSGLPDIANTFMLLDIEELGTDHADLEQLPVPPFTSGDRLVLPDEVRQLGEVRFSGNFTGFTRSFTAYGTSRTALGALSTDVSYERDTVSDVFTLSGRMATSSFLAGPLLHTPAIGPMAANIRIKGTGRTLPGMKADLEGQFPSFTFNGRTINGITAKGRLERNLFNGELTAEDDDLVLAFKGLADLRGRWPLVDFTANVQHADLNALGLAPTDEYNTLSMLVDAHGRLSPDSLLGQLIVRDISYCRGSKEHDLGDIALTSSRRGGENVLELDATFAQAEVVGTFLPTRLMGAVANVVYSVFPSLVEEMDYRQAEQDFRFSVVTRNTDPVLDLVLPALRIGSGSTVSGSLNSSSLDMAVTVDVPHMRYGDLQVNDVRVIADKTLDVLAFSARSDRQVWKDSVWFAGTSITGKAYQDELEFSLGWDDSSSGTNGDLDVLGEVRGLGRYSLDLLPSHVQFGRGDWVNVTPAHAEIDSTTIRVDSLVLLNDGQRIALDGVVSKNPAMPLHFDLENVSLENLDPFFDGPSVTGLAAGDGLLYGLYGDPYLVSYLCLDSLSVEDNPIGDLRFTASWAEGRRAIDLDGMLTRGPIKALDFQGELTMGEEYLLDLQLVMDRFDLTFIEPYLPEGLSDIQGLVTGTLDVNGRLDDPRIRGEVDLTDAGLRIDYLNTLYRFSHRVKVEPDMFALDLVTVYDEEGNTAKVGGTILHNGLKDWNFNVWGTMDGLMVLNTQLKDNELYYGKAYATGDLEVGGYADNMEITVDARTAPGTDIHFPIGGSTEISDIGFVHFVGGDSVQIEEVPVDLSGISLDLAVEVTPDASFELIFDPTVGDILSGRGVGNMEMTVSQTGEFDMRGQVEVTEGDYLFTLRNVVNKRFQIEPGGSIAWFGDPFDAQLDLTATYRVRAPLYDVMAEKNDVYRKRVPVDVVMHLRDRLLNPEINFDVRLPSVDESVRTQVNSVLSTEQELNRQVFALIVLNKFVQPPQYTGSGTPGGSNVAGSTGTELLSNQVSNWLSRLSNDVDLGVNWRSGNSLTQDEVELAVSTQLFDERLLLSTNVGVQYGAQSAQNSNTLVGDFQVEYLMTDDGKLRLKAFSISNDRNLNRADQALTTQGAGVAYREEFNTMGEFWQKVLNIFRSSEKDREFD